MPVKGSNSTLANTDTSAAKTLSPAPDAAAREEKAVWQETSDDMKGASGTEGKTSGGDSGGPSTGSGGSGSTDPSKELPKVSPAEYGTLDEKSEASSGSTQGSKSKGNDNAAGESGSADATKELPKVSPAEYGTLDENTSGTSGSAQGSMSSANETGSDGNSNRSSGGVPADPAPTYVTNVLSAGHTKPKGKNITEGGFDDDPKNNASFNSDIGTEDDPARGAELQFQKRVAATVGSGPRQSGVTGDGQYDVLETDQQI